MPEIRLLNCSVDEAGTSEFRILVDGRYVKYLTIDHGIYTVEDMCFEPSLVAILPSLPPGDWNEGHITRTSADGPPQFVRYTKTSLPQVTNTWHPRFIDHLDLKIGRVPRSNVCEATAPCFNDTVLVKFARFAWEIPWLDQETLAYSWIEGHNIGPAFLGHLTEEGRVIGFVMENIAQAEHGAPENLFGCQEALKKLHDLGIKHGDVNKHNFLCRDGDVRLIDFECAIQDAGPDILKDEMMSLERELAEMTGRGGVIVTMRDSTT